MIEVTGVTWSLGAGGMGGGPLSARAMQEQVFRAPRP